MQKLYDVHSYEVRRYGVCGRVLLDRVGQATPPWHWSTPSFYYSRGGGDFILQGHFENNKGGMGHIGDLEMTYATHEWNCGELLGSRRSSTGERGRAMRGNDERGEGAGGRESSGWRDVQDTRMSERTLTALVCMCGTSGCANSVFVLSAWRCMPCEQGETTRARGEERSSVEVVSQGTSE